MQTIVNQILTNYIDQGSGKVILLLHGWGSSLTSFNDLIKDLAAKYRVIAVDFPGFGGSSEPETAWTVADYAKFTRDFLNKIDAKEVSTVIGHSFGGRVIIKLISEKLLNPKKIVFIDSAGIKPRKSIKQKFRFIVAKVGKVVLKPLPKKAQNGLRRKISSSDYINSSGVMRETFLVTIREDLQRELPTIHQPTLLIWGEDDTETPLSDAKIFAAMIPHSKLHILKNAGHYAFIDQPFETKKLIREFLK